MNFRDKMLVRLADPETRTGVFDPASLEQILQAAVDADAAMLDGPYRPIFDDFRLGFAPRGQAVLEGTWRPAGAPQAVEARFSLSGLQTSVRAEALWKGGIAASAALPAGRISAVEAKWPDLGGVDREIAAALGALPEDAAALERERRARVMARIRATFSQPSAFTDEMFEDWLSRAGCRSVRELLEGGGAVTHGGGVQVQLVETAPPAPSSRIVPVSAALMIRDAVFPLADLVYESKLVRAELEALGFEVPRDPALRARHAVIVIWVVPAAVFDDPDWPGAPAETNAADARDVRRAAAGAWLAREGIGLAAVTP